MAIVKLPVNQKTYRNADDEELNVLGDKLIDGVVNEFPHTKKRFGLKEFVNLGTARQIDGLYYWDDKNTVMAISKGKVFKIEEDKSITDLTGIELEKDKSTTFIDGISQGTRYLFMANGSKVVYTDNSNVTDTLSGSSVPTSVSSVAILDNYLLVNEDGANTFKWSGNTSGVIDPLAWSIGDGNSSASAESNPDNILSVIVLKNEIYLIGRETIEVWYNQGVVGIPFIRIGGAFVQRGCIAKDSVQIINDTFYWLDNERRVSRLVGRNFQVVDTPFAKEFQSFNNVSDAIGNHIQVDGNGYYMINFPSERRSYVFDYINNEWSELSYWNTATAERENFLGQHSIFATRWNKHLVGSRIDGKIYEISFKFYDDDGSPIRFEKTTGNINHGSTSEKASTALFFRLLRGQANVVSPKLLYSFRDNGKNSWSNEIPIDLGSLGDTELVKELRPMGTYRERQHKFVVTDDVPFTIIDVEEEVRTIK